MKYLFLLLFSLLPNLSWSQCIGTEGQVTWSYWQEVNPLYRFDEFKYKDRFPKGPDGFRKINSLQSPYHFDEFLAGQIKGFISVPEQADVVFNVTGNDSIQFFLSTDHTAANLVMIASSGAGDVTEHNIFSTQTSNTISLQAGQEYYFEVLYNENFWRDFGYVYWKTTFLNGLGTEVSWQPVTFEYLKDVCEVPCSNRGTPCDDNNSYTINDQQDGNCNCIGDPITANICVGERGKFQQYIYEGIETRELEALYNAPNYPNAPDAIRPLDGDLFERTIFAQGDVPNYGIRIQAYLSVPVTGNYSFNITGAIENRFYLSSDDTEANKETNVILTDGWVDYYQHVSNNSWAAQQTMSDIYLEAGKYYYVELVHKGTSQWNFYSIFWNGPQHPDKNWRRLPNFYLFDHTSNEPCLKAGVACSDNDPYTSNDQWDGHCNCAGIPCSGPEDCDDPTVIYPKYDDCATTEQLDNRANDAWLSCVPIDPNPNPARGEGQWIQYNLRAPYTIDNIHIWNYNVANATDLGFQNVAIDYSLDGTNWTELGVFTWSQATGASGYEGFDLPTLADFTAQYVLFTSLDAASTCKGLSKVTFSAYDCPTISFANLSAGQTIHSPASLDVTVQVSTKVASVALFIGEHLISNNYTAPYSWKDAAPLTNLPEGNYTLTAVTTDGQGVKCAASLPFVVTACQGITDLPNSNQTTGRINPTISSTTTVTSTIELTEVASRENRSTTLNPLASSVQLFPNPVQNEFSVSLYTEQGGDLQIEMFNTAGQKVPNLSYRKNIGTGLYQIPFVASQLANGLYYCKIKVGEELYTTSFVKGSL